MNSDIGVAPNLKLDWNERGEPPLPLPALLCLDLAASQPAAFADMWQHVVDGLTEQIALLDEDWTVLVVNTSWARVAESYGHSALMPGTNYLQFCREMADGGLDVAVDVVAGIEEIIEGKRNSFQLVYRASDPEVGHDHQLCINRFEVVGRKFASVTRYDVTRLVELRRLREDFCQSVLLSQAEERRRIGREIHDSTMQLIACLDMKIGQLKQSRKTAKNDPDLEEMRELVKEMEQAIRSISFLTHPPLLDKQTLPEALDALVQGFARRSGLKVKFETLGEWQICCSAAEGAVYRIVQEGLSNIHRHSKSKHATVRLKRGKALTHVVIADDGIGMQDVIHSGVGLAGMRSRLSELGGRLSIFSRPTGTAVVASIPAERRAWRFRAID